MIVTCKRDGCGWVGPIEEAPPAFGPYHDCRCPKCGTTNVETDETNGDYGTDNFLHIFDNMEKP